jgi:hypothetical protein
VCFRLILIIRAHVEKQAVPNSDVSFDFIVSALDESYFVIDESGTRHRLAQIVLKIECRLEVSTVLLSRANYEPTSVLYGSVEHMGQPIQVAWTEEQGGRMVFGASIGEPQTSKSDTSRPRKSK